MLEHDEAQNTKTSVFSPHSSQITVPVKKPGFEPITLVGLFLSLLCEEEEDDDEEDDEAERLIA